MYSALDRGAELQGPCVETCFEILNLAHFHWVQFLPVGAVIAKQNKEIGPKVVDFSPTK